LFRKVKTRQRKATLKLPRPDHPDAKDALKMLLAPTPVAERIAQEEKEKEEEDEVGAEGLWDT
jgi:hypothetical protein